MFGKVIRAMLADLLNCGMNSFPFYYSIAFFKSGNRFFDSDIFLKVYRETVSRIFCKRADVRLSQYQCVENIVYFLLNLNQSKSDAEIN